jgi:hypothetical protein
MNGNQTGTKNALPIFLMLVFASQVPPAETLPMSPCVFYQLRRQLVINYAQKAWSPLDVESQFA